MSLCSHHQPHPSPWHRLSSTWSRLSWDLAEAGRTVCRNCVWLPRQHDVFEEHDLFEVHPRCGMCGRLIHFVAEGFIARIDYILFIWSPADGLFVPFQVSALADTAMVSVHVKVSMRTYFFTFLGKVPKSGLDGPAGKCMFVLIRNRQPFSHLLYPAGTCVYYFIRLAKGLNALLTFSKSRLLVALIFVYCWTIFCFIDCCTILMFLSFSLWV